MGKQKKKQIKKGYYFLLPIILCIFLIILILIAYQLFLTDKYHPFTYIGDTNISFLSKGKAIKIVSSKMQTRAQHTLDFQFRQEATDEAKIFTIFLASTSAKIDYSSLDYIFNNQHTQKFFDRLSSQFLSLFKSKPSLLTTTFNIEKQLIDIDSKISRSAQNATLSYNETVTLEGTPSANIQIKEGMNGIELDKNTLVEKLINYINFGKIDNSIPVAVTAPKINAAYLEKVKNILEQVQSQPIRLYLETLPDARLPAGQGRQAYSWILDAKALLGILDLAEGKELLDRQKADLYVKKIAAEINRSVQQGQFEFDPNTKRVSVFKPSLQGRKLDENQTLSLIKDALQNQTKDIDLPVAVVNPKVKTADVNNLGIRELIGRGISNFVGSIPNRVFNVKLTASKINGTLIAPGEVFSFNQTIGDISAATGFKQAYVIKEGRTVLDDGGGVCQDSTTLFRAVLNAGLPVIKRTAHAYRVGYYEQGFPPGLDATVFYPSVDFQFKNDTPAHILIQAYVIGNTLYFDLYGTSDGRVSNITTPIVTNRTPAPPALYQDDPTLPKGVTKQVDWAAQGATVRFKRIVTKNGENIINETWTSNYKPWQAIYLVGTQ